MYWLRCSMKSFWMVITISNQSISSNSNIITNENTFICDNTYSRKSTIISYFDCSSNLSSLKYASMIQTTHIPSTCGIKPTTFTYYNITTLKTINFQYATCLQATTNLCPPPNRA